MAAPALIAVEKVGRRFQTTSGPVEALRDVSLSVSEGEFCTIIGPLGCGKSTLLGMLGGLVAPDTGRILIVGKVVTGPDPRAVATVFQDPGLFPWRTVVWYPSLMLFFGLDAASKIAFGFLLGFFPITLAVLAGIRQVNPQLVTVARAFGARPLTVFVKVLLPGMLFTLVGGLRTGLALSVVGVIVGEILGSKTGMGALINHAYGLLRTADYVALVALTLVVVVATEVGASRLERRARRWTE